MAIAEIIKYNGLPDVFAWKYPNSELGTWSQLIVNESQEAILVKGGKVCDVFGAGRHTLNTKNIPILNKIINLPFGGRSPFSAEVWFINKVFSLDIKWGTATPIQIQDPKYKIFVPVRAFGQFGIQIESSEKFLKKIVGTLPKLDKESIVKFFRGLYLTKSKDAISSYLVHKNISIMEINAYLDEISSFLKEKMDPDFAEYGIRLVSFFVNDISVPEDDAAVSQLKSALAKRAEMEIIGYSYQQERSFNTLETAASNSGGVMGAGMELSMGVAMGGVIGSQFSGITKAVNTEKTKRCPECNMEISEDARFCRFCGCDTTRAKTQETAQIKCSKCGKPMPADTKFCPECGNKYNPCANCKADMPADATVCPMCGTSIPRVCPGCGCMIAGGKFCSECGMPLTK